MHDKVRYIITCPARTGSSMLVGYLQSHPDICSHAEVFAPGHVEFYGIHAKLKPPLLDLFYELRASDPIAYLNNYVFYAGKRKAVGFKFKYEELSLPQFKHLAEHIRNDLSIKIIHLTRDDLLERYVSQYIAVHVNNFFNTQKEDHLLAPVTIRLRPKECQKEFDFTSQRQKQYRAFFSRHVVLEISYEDLVQRSQQTLAIIQDFLGVEQRELKTGQLKLQRNPMSKVLENYDELNAFFAETAYARYFYQEQ